MNIGDSVRLIKYIGSKRSVRKGKITAFVKRQNRYGAPINIQYAQIHLSDGSRVEKPVIAVLWDSVEGVLEYQEW